MTAGILDAATAGLAAIGLGFLLNIGGSSRRAQFIDLVLLGMIVFGVVAGSEIGPRLGVRQFVGSFVGGLAGLIVVVSVRRRNAYR